MLVLVVGRGREASVELLARYRARLGVDQQVFEAVSRLVALGTMTGFAEILELLVLAVPSVAVLVVLPGVGPVDVVSARDAGDRITRSVPAGTPHDSYNDGTAYSTCRGVPVVHRVGQSGPFKRLPVDG